MTSESSGVTAGGMRSAGPNQGMAPSAPRRWSIGRIIALVVGILMLLGSLGIAAAGGVLAVADKGLRDGQGYFMSAQQSLSSTGYAVSSDRVELHLEGTGRFVPDRFIGDVKVTVTPRGGGPVFVGIAPAADAASYLTGVQHSVVVDFTSRGGQVRSPVYRQEAGGAPSVAPGDSKIWAAKASGTGTQSVVWSAQPGDWAVVVMNADGTSPVSADVGVGATFPGIGLVIWVLLAIAAVLFVLSVVIIVLALRAGTRSPAPGAPVREPAGS